MTSIWTIMRFVNCRLVYQVRCELNIKIYDNSSYLWHRSCEIKPYGSKTKWAGTKQMKEAVFFSSTIWEKLSKTRVFSFHHIHGATLQSRDSLHSYKKQRDSSDTNNFFDFDYRTKNVSFWPDNRCPWWTGPARPKRFLSGYVSVS